MRGSGKWGIYKAHSTTGDWRGARIRKDVSKRQPGQEVGLRAEVRRLAFFCFIPGNDNLESTWYKWRKFHSQIYLEEAIQSSGMKENIGDRIFSQYSVHFSSVAQSCPTLCDPMNCGTLGLPVHHQLPEPTQTHVHWVGDAIQPSHPLLSPSPPALNLSQHQRLFKWISSSHQVAKVLEFQLQHQSFREHPGLISFRRDLLICSPRDSQESSPTPQFKSINSSVLSFLYIPTLTSIHDYWKNHGLDQTDLCQQSNVSAF